MRRHIQIAIVVGITMFAMGALGLSDGRAQTPAETPAAAPAAELDGATLYMTRTCFACHGKDASTPLLPNYPKLAGQNSEYLLQQMKDIKSGARDNGQTPAMKGIMHLVDEREMEVLATYLSEFVPPAKQ